MAIDVEELVSIDAARFSLRIERSKRVGSEKKSNSSLLLLVLIGMYLKNKKKNFVSNLKQKLKPKLNLLIKSNGDQSSPTTAPNLISLKLL